VRSLRGATQRESERNLTLPTPQGQKTLQGPWEKLKAPGSSVLSNDQHGGDRPSSHAIGSERKCNQRSFDPGKSQRKLRVASKGPRQEHVPERRMLLWTKLKYRTFKGENGHTSHSTPVREGDGVCAASRAVRSGGERTKHSYFLGKTGPRLKRLRVGDQTLKTIETI